MKWKALFIVLIVVASCRRAPDRVLDAPVVVMPGPWATFEKYYDGRPDPAADRTALSFVWIELRTTSRRSYKDCVEAEACTDIDTRTGDEPITVGHEDASRYCRWRGARLPSADEWERARPELELFFQGYWSIRGSQPEWIRDGAINPSSGSRRVYVDSGQTGGVIRCALGLPFLDDLEYVPRKHLGAE